MKIKIRNDKIGEIVWELPEDLTKHLRESTQHASDEIKQEEHVNVSQEEILNDISEKVKHQITNFFLILGACLFVPTSMPGIFSKIQNFTNSLMKELKEYIKKQKKYN